MKIQSITKKIEINYYVETDADFFTTYRRSRGGSWERLMGESWESVYGNEEEELERLFLELEDGGEL
jgi:hypothetical protein